MYTVIYEVRCILSTVRGIPQSVIRFIIDTFIVLMVHLDMILIILQITAKTDYKVDEWTGTALELLRPSSVEQHVYA